MTTAGANELFGGRCRTTQPRARDYYRSGPKRQRQLSLGVPGVAKKGPLATKRLPAPLHNPAPRALSPQPSALRGDSQPGPVAVWDGCPYPATTTSPRPGAPDSPDTVSPAPRSRAWTPQPRAQLTSCPRRSLLAMQPGAGARESRLQGRGAAHARRRNSCLPGCGRVGLRGSGRAPPAAPHARPAQRSARPPRPLLP